jgi:hypothetical protein
MLLLALIVPFVAVAPNGQHLVLEGGSRETRSGAHALHMLLDAPADPDLRAAIIQAVKRMPSGRLRAQVWHRGDAQQVKLSLKCLDSKGRAAGEKIRSRKPSSRWQPLRLEGTFASTCASVELWVEARGPGSVALDDSSLLDPQGKERLNNPGFEDGWRSWRQGDQSFHGGTLWVNDTPFVPWGLNYDRTILDGKDILLEEAPLDKIDRDFREARRLGANCIRLFLQLGYFMPRHGEIDEKRLEFLDQVILRARKRNLRVDLTGLSHIDAGNVPAWYIERSPEEMLQGEAIFWEAIARRYANEPAIFLLNLQNEPFLSGKEEVRKPIGCFKMSGGRNFCYVNPHPRSIGAERWAHTLVDAIRRHDKKHLITIGLLPTATPVFGGGNPGFSVPAVAGLLDVIAIHLYPDRKGPREEFIDVNQAWLEMVLRYASGFGKPVIVEEWFPLWPPESTTATWADWFPRFMDASIGSVCGWLTFYHASLVDGIEAKQPYPHAQIELFARRADEMRNMRPARKPGTATLKIDPEDLWKTHEKVREVLTKYRQLRASGHEVDFH